MKRLPYFFVVFIVFQIPKTDLNSKKKIEANTGQKLSCADMKKIMALSFSQKT